MQRNAFTLIELLVVIAIIGLLSTIAVVSLSTTRMNARNTQRKANLVQVSKSLELYYSDFGKYPDTSGAMYGNCTGAGGQPDVDTLNASPTNCNDILTPSWIPGLVSCGYITKLPRDPNTEKSNPNSASLSCQTTPASNCFRYHSNGTDYKLLAVCTPEGTLSASDPFYDPPRPTYTWQITNNLGVTSAW